MNISATVHRVDEIAGKLTALGHECAERTVRATWQCPRGKRAEKKAEDFSRAARKLAGEIEATGARLRTILTK